MLLKAIALVSLTLIVVGCAQAVEPAAPPAGGQVDAGVGYPTVAAALAGLRAKPGTMVSEQSGWTVIADKAANTVWSFPPPADPAYPSAVRRETVDQGGNIFLKTNILCQAQKAACDRLVAQFRVLNERVKQDLTRTRPAGSQN